MTLGEWILTLDPLRFPPSKNISTDGAIVPANQRGWYEKVAVLSLKHSTFRSYRLIIDHNLIPAFGSKPINEITSRMISDLISNTIKGGIRSATARNIKNCLSAIMRHAVNPDGLLSPRILPAVFPYRSPRTSGNQKSRIRSPGRTVRRSKRPSGIIPRLLSSCRLGFRTGLRIGEIIGLQWQDVTASKTDTRAEEHHPGEDHDAEEQIEPAPCQNDLSACRSFKAAQDPYGRKNA